MRKLTKPAIILALAMISAAATQAAETPPPAAFGLQQCIELALGGQADIVAAKNNLRTAKAQLTKKNSSYFPKVSIESNAFTIGEQSVIDQNGSGVAVKVSQTIFDGGVREANVESGKNTVRQNSSALDRTVQTVTFNVTSAYYDALRSKHLLDVAESKVKYNEALLEQIKAQADLGAAAKADVLPVEAELANAQVDSLSAQNKVRTSLLDLQSAIGIQIKKGFAIQEADEVKKADPKPLERYLTLALAERPDIMNNQYALNAARANVKGSKIYLYPRLVVSGDYTKSISGDYASDRTQILGGVAFNVFDGGSAQADVRIAESSRDTLARQLEQLRNDVGAQVEEAYLNLQNASERMDASAKSLEASQTNFDVQKDKYGQGLATTLDLLNAETQLTTARSNMVQAKYDYYTAVAQLDYAVGRQGVLYEK